jgi:hypothetical protein
VQFERHLFQIQNDVSRIFHDALNRRELMFDAFDFDGGHRCAFN